MKCYLVIRTQITEDARIRQDLVEHVKNGQSRLRTITAIPKGLLLRIPIWGLETTTTAATQAQAPMILFGATPLIQH